MKIRLQLILTFATLSLMGTVAYGQDAHFSDFDVMDSERERLEKEKILYSPGGEGEIRYIPARIDPKTANTTSKDSVSTATPKPATIPQVVHPAPSKVKPEGGPKSPAKQQPPKEDDDAILSFNFLYYIIQKYKLQDIIE
jgi:hypothetical protein